MNIILFTLNYVNTRKVGAELAIHELAKHLKTRGHHITAVTVNPTPRTTIDGIQVHGRVTPQRPQADLIIANAGISNTARRYWPKTPLAVYAHNNQLETILDVHNSKPNLLITNTHNAQLTYHNTINQNSVVLHPITHGQPQPRGTHITLINLTDNKGQKTFYHLAEQLPHLNFLGIKGGYGQQTLKPLPNTTIQDHGDLTQTWTQTQLLLVPSTQESYSMTAAEATNRGIPVIATNLPGIKEAAGNQTYNPTPNFPPNLITQTLNNWDHYHQQAINHANQRQTAQQLEEVTAALENLKP